jgi:hypothetical protein
MYVCLEYYTNFYTIHRFDVYVFILYNILYNIKYMITYQTFVKVLIMYLCFTSNFILMSSQCKLLSHQICKATPFTYELGSIQNFEET